MLRFLTISNITLFVYYLLSNIVYLVLLITAIAKNAAHRARLASLRLEHLRVSPFTPPVTLIIPTWRSLSLTMAPWTAHWNN
jgi:hypothetical protein